MKAQTHTIPLERAAGIMAAAGVTNHMDVLARAIDDETLEVTEIHGTFMVTPLGLAILIEGCKRSTHKQKSPPRRNTPKGRYG
jgi:hypothetical protein